MSSKAAQSEQEKSQSKEVETEEQKIQKREEPKIEIIPLEKSIVDKITTKFGDKVTLVYAKPKRIKFNIDSFIWCFVYLINKFY